MKSRRRCFLLLLTLALSAATLLRADPGELASLRTKAEKGNAIAQYNLGLAYAQGRDDLPSDLTQAYVWLTLSGDSSSTRRALLIVLGKISNDQLAEARRLVESYHGTPAGRNLALASAPATVPAPSRATPAKATPVAPAPSAPVVVSAPIVPAPAAHPASPSLAEGTESDELVALRKDKHQLGNELALAWKENDKLKASLVFAQAEAARTQSLAPQLEQRSQDLSTALSEIAKAHERLDAQSAKVAKLQEEVTAKSTLAADAGAARAKAEAAATAQAAEITSLNQKLAAAGGAAGDQAEVRENLAKTRAQLAAAEAQATGLKTQLTQDRAQSDHRTELLVAELATTHKESDAAQALATTTAAQNRRLVAERDATESARAALAQDKETLTTQLAQARSAAPAIDLGQAKALATELAATKQKLTESETARARLATEKDFVADQFTHAKTAAESAQASQARAAALATELEAAQHELAEARPRLAASEAARAKSEENLRMADSASKSYAHQLVVVQNQVQSLEAERGTVRAELSRTAGQVTQLSTDLASARKNGEAAQALAATAEAEKSRSAAAASAALAINVRLVAERDAAETARTRLATEKDTLAAQLTQANSAASAAGPAAAKAAAVAAELESARHELAAEREKTATLTATAATKDAALGRALQDAEKSRAQVATLNEKLSAAGQPTAAELSARAAAAKSAAKLNQLQDDLATLRTDRQRLAAELATASQDGTKARANLATTSAELATLRASVTRLEADRASAAAAAGDTAQQLAQTRALQSQLAELKEKLAASESSRGELSAQLATAAAAEKTSISQVAALRPQISSLESERTALQQQLAETRAGSAAGSTAAAATQAETEAKLATSLRSYHVLQGENDALNATARKAAADLTAAETERNTLQQQLASAKTAPAATSADTDARLTTTLRSYSLLQGENDTLKADARKADAEKAALEAQLDPVRAQVRELQAKSTALATENAQLKTRLALTPSPAVTTPTRPATPAAAPAARTHIIVEGDTLAKISRLYYGTTSRWPDILSANREALRDERSLIVGHTLVIP